MEALTRGSHQPWVAAPVLGLASHAPTLVPWPAPAPNLLRGEGGPGPGAFSTLLRLGMWAGSLGVLSLVPVRGSEMERRGWAPWPVLRCAASPAWIWAQSHPGLGRLAPSPLQGRRGEGTPRGFTDPPTPSPTAPSRLHGAELCGTRQLHRQAQGEGARGPALEQPRVRIRRPSPWGLG